MDGGGLGAEGGEEVGEEGAVGGHFVGCGCGVGDCMGCWMAAYCVGSDRDLSLRIDVYMGSSGSVCPVLSPRDAS